MPRYHTLDYDRVIEHLPFTVAQNTWKLQLGLHYQAQSLLENKSPPLCAFGSKSGINTLIEILIVCYCLYQLKVKNLRSLKAIEVSIMSLQGIEEADACKITPTCNPPFVQK